VTPVVEDEPARTPIAETSPADGATPAPTPDGAVESPRGTPEAETPPPVAGTPEATPEATPEDAPPAVADPPTEMPVPAETPVVEDEPARTPIAETSPADGATPAPTPDGAVESPRRTPDVEEAPRGRPAVETQPPMAAKPPATPEATPEATAEDATPAVADPPTESPAPAVTPVVEDEPARTPIAETSPADGATPAPTPDGAVESPRGTPEVEAPPPMAATPEAMPEATPAVTPETTPEATPAPTMSAPTTTPAPAPAPVAGRRSPADEPAGARSCAVYAATGGAVRMPAATAGGGDGWVVETVSGRRALTWKPDVDDAASLDAPGTGTREWTFRADVAGTYRVVLGLSAPHPTDFNDVWVRLGDGAARVKVGSGRVAIPETAGWFKVYQNAGGGRWVFGGVTVDFDGHYPLTRRLAAGAEFTIGLSGRSSRLAVADVMLVACDVAGTDCGAGTPSYDRAVSMGFSACA